MFGVINEKVGILFYLLPFLVKIKIKIKIKEVLWTYVISEVRSMN